MDDKGKTRAAVERTGLLKSYSAATRVLAPALPLWLKKRAAKGKEDPARLSERQGVAGVPRPAGEVVWMHAASVGESQMLMPVINRVYKQYPDVNLVITTGTVTSAEVITPQLPKTAAHQYAPADHPKAVRNFLDHWKPSLAIFAESELWPNMIMEAKARGVPMALINARMSAASIERWAKRGKKSGKALLEGFDLILAADKQTADGLSWLTGREIEAAGNLKDAAPALPVDKPELKAMKAAIGRRSIWAAASTHSGEEEHIAQAVVEIKKSRPKSLLLLAPRHPERIDEVQAVLDKAGLSSQRRSDGKIPTPETDVFIIDGMGHMGLVYSLAKISFVGGSLVDGLKGHNPLEPARLGSAVITGTHISSFADTYMGLLAFDGAKRILNPKHLAPAVLNFMKDAEARKKQADAALKYAQSRDAVLDYVWAQLEPLIPGAES
ncbi:MAG: 3-deoxy-D-manno-octulosonic acid transferase [Hyphomonadaceae bacterium]|nr:3-deoxy-D-manno-octulosonic acid transferase [Hyphomonadaceae bacterium]